MAQVFGLGFPVRSHQSGLVRRNAAGKEQQRRRPGEFHAQHRQQHRNVDGHHADRAPGAVSPGVPGGARYPGKADLYPGGYGADGAPGCIRSGCLAGREPGLRPDLSGADRPGDDARLHRYLLGSGVGAAIMFLLSFALRKNEPGGGGEVAVG